MSSFDRDLRVSGRGDTSMRRRFLIGTYRSNILSRTNYVGQVPYNPLQPASSSGSGFGGSGSPTGLPPYLAVIVLVSGVLGGLLFVISTIVFCKYCVHGEDSCVTRLKKNKRMSRMSPMDVAREAVGMPIRNEIGFEKFFVNADIDLLDVENESEDNNEEIQEVSVECNVPPAIDVAPSASARETDEVLCAVKKSHKQTNKLVEYASPAENSKATTKTKKLRWTSFEQKMLFENFGRHITEKRNPSGSEINVFAKKIFNTRTAAQIRTQINNYIKKKNNSFPDVC